MSRWQVVLGIILSLTAHGGAGFFILGIPNADHSIHETIIIGEVELVTLASSDYKDLVLEVQNSVQHRIENNRNRQEVKHPSTKQPRNFSSGRSQQLGDTFTVTASSRGDNVSYEVLLARALERVKRYPRKAIERRIEGDALLALTLANNGDVNSVTLQQSAGHPLLDQEVLSLVERAKPFPPLPQTTQGEKLAFHVPIRFRLN